MVLFQECGDWQQGLRLLEEYRRLLNPEPRRRGASLYKRGVSLSREERVAGSGGRGRGRAGGRGRGRAGARGRDRGRGRHKPRNLPRKLPGVPGKLPEKRPGKVPGSFLRPWSPQWKAYNLVIACCDKGGSL